jgi:hypothetical protein
MGLLDSLLGGGQTQQELQGFVNRFEQGQPWEGYSDQEVMNRYQQIAPQLPAQQFQQSAQQAFDRLSPDQRTQLGQELMQQAQAQGVPLPPQMQQSNQQQFQQSGFLAQMMGQMHQQQPGLLGQLLGGGQVANSGGNLFSSPIAKAALAGVAAMAVKNMVGSGAGAGLRL